MLASLVIRPDYARVIDPAALPHIVRDGLTKRLPTKDFLVAPWISIAQVRGTDSISLG